MTSIPMSKPWQVKLVAAVYVECGVMWRGVEWCGVVWSSVEGCGVVWSGVEWCGVVWSGVE